MPCFIRYWTTGLVAGLLFVTGCDWVTKSSPETARLRLEGTPDVEVRLVTSTDFLTGTKGVSGETTVSFLQADTTTVSLPFEQTYDIEEDQRFVARAIRVDPGADELVMRGWVDGDPKYNRTGSPAPPDTVVQFIYVFRSNTDPPDDPQA